MVVGEWDWDGDWGGIGPETPWKYPRVMLAGPKVAGLSIDFHFHVAMLDVRYHAVGKPWRAHQWSGLSQSRFGRWG